MQNPEYIYKTYSQKVFNLAYRMTGNKDDADDITQETFILAFKSLDKFKGKSDIYTWLYTIAKNNCLKFLDKKKKSSFLALQELIDKAGSPVSELLPEDEKLLYISQVKDGCLSGLLRCLSLQQRLAFILNILLDLPLEQVASIIGKSENAARILVHRSKQNIKEFLCCNCSLYDSKNPCRCESLINFSLKQGWIGKEKILFKDSVRIESEISSLKNVVNLYKSLNEQKPSDVLNKDIQSILSNHKDFLIFNEKKVK